MIPQRECRKSACTIFGCLVLCRVSVLYYTSLLTASGRRIEYIIVMPRRVERRRYVKRVCQASQSQQVGLFLLGERMVRGLGILSDKGLFSTAAHKQSSQPRIIMHASLSGTHLHKPHISLSPPNVAHIYPALFLPICLLRSWLTLWNLFEP